MIDRIVLNDPVTANEAGFECECEDNCGTLFTYREVYTLCIDWIGEHGKNDYDYYVIRTDCTNPRPGNVVAYVDYNGAIMASIYAEEIT